MSYRIPPIDPSAPLGRPLSPRPRADSPPSPVTGIALDAIAASLQTAPPEGERPQGIALETIPDVPAIRSATGPLKPFSATIKWKNHTYLLTQELPESCGTHWEEYVKGYERVLTQLKTIQPGVSELDLTPLENKGVAAESGNVKEMVTDADTIKFANAVYKYESVNVVKEVVSPEVSDWKPTGFENPGNLCYLNSTMTRIAGNPVARELFEHTERKKIHEIFDQYNKPTGPINLEPLRETMDPRFEKGKQQDSNEAFRDLVKDINWPQLNPVIIDEKKELTSMIDKAIKDKPFDQPPQMFSGMVNRFDEKGEKKGDDVTFSLEYKLGDTEYDLVSFDVHRGRAVSPGHYVSYLRTFERNEDLFWEINDTSVSPRTKEQFLEAAKQAYNFDYIRRDKTDELRMKNVDFEDCQSEVSQNPD